MIAKIYTRLSKDEPGQTSIADQERECRGLAQRLGIIQIQVFPENPGTSAFKDVSRPIFDRLIDSLQAGDVVLAWSVDRVTRHGMEEAGKVLRILEERGARLVTVSDGVDTGQLNTDINVGIRAIMAREYSKGLSKNIKRGKASGAAAGKWAGGQKWYGYAVDSDGKWRGPRVIDQTEAKVLHEIRQRYVSGERMLRIVTGLNERGVPATQGGKWRAENTLRLLMNKHYIAVRIHDGAEYPGGWPPIFTPAEHAEILTYRNSEARMMTWPKGPTGTLTYLLTGFVYCHCGSKMVGNRRTGERYKHVRRYKCRLYDSHGAKIGCGACYRMAEPLELLVSESIMFRLDTPDLAALLSPTDDTTQLDALVAEQAQLKQLLADAHNDYYNPKGALRLDRGHFTTLKLDLEAQLDGIERKLSGVVSSRTNIQLEVGQTLRSWWEQADLDGRRRLIGLLVDKVICNPSKTGGIATWHGYRFKPEDVEIKWKC